jgi:hypothetical protein
MTLQNWSLVCCIIEVVIEVLTILVYGIVFYRYYSKRRLRKSMAQRDRARSDLYLAQLKSQSAPNTPGFGPLSPRDGGWRPPPGHPMSVSTANPNADVKVSDPDGDGVQYAIASPRQFNQPKPFSLQPPPIRIHAATPKMDQDGFEEAATSSSSTASPQPPPQETQFEHAPVAEGEQQYAAVAIPGAYASPLNSPGFAQTHSGQPAGFNFGLDSQLR